VGQATAWGPSLRPIDVYGIVLLVALVLWVWFASWRQGGDAAPLVGLLLAVGLLAASGRWATYFHATVVPALLAAGVAVYALLAGDGLPQGLGPDDSEQAAGALFAVATGAAALVTLRARWLWPRISFGLLTLALTSLTWNAGSRIATVIAAAALLTMLGLLVLPMQERRWLVVWPALVAVLVLLGSVTVAAFTEPEPGDLGDPDPTLVTRWAAALDGLTESPLYGSGRGVVDPDLEGLDRTSGWAHHEPLQVAAETGLVGGLLLLALLWWALAWVARPGGGPGSAVAGLVIAGSIAHACLAPIWHVPAVSFALAVLAGAASLRGGDASWRLAEAWDRARERSGADGP
jgi:hypothetical protein